MHNRIRNSRNMAAKVKQDDKMRIETEKHAGHAYTTSSAGSHIYGELSGHQYTVVALAAEGPHGTTA